MEFSISIPARESDYLYTGVSKIPGAGIGLFTAISIYKYEIIAVFHGRILSSRLAHQRAVKHLDAYFISMADGSTMDCMHVHSFAKFANDATGVNSGYSRNNSVITLNENGDVCIVAKTTIPAGSEIYCSYGKKYWSRFNRRPA